MINGENIHKLNDNKRTRFRARHMGFVFQFYNLLPVLDAVENVEMPLLVAGVRERDARKKAMRTLELVGLKDWATHKPGELSGGQRQRVTVARSLVNDPDIVWADEPTGDLDTEMGTEIIDLMCELNEKQKQTFVIVTHDPEIGQRAGRIIYMRNGLIEKIVDS